VSPTLQAVAFPPRLIARMQAMLGLRSHPITGAASEGWQRDVSENGITPSPARIEKSPARSERPTLKAQIARQLRLYQRDTAQYCGDDRVPFAALARLIGVSRDTLHEAARGTMSESTAERLIKIIAWIEQGRLRFRRHGQGWVDEYRMPPDPLPPPQPRLIESEAWNEWARCSSCGGNRWALGEIAGRRHKLCGHCLPPSQWRAIGAIRPRSQTRSSRLAR
jgi:hypothetical protein